MHYFDSEKSLKHDDRPSLQFYPKDWMAETGLRVCSLAARGLWMDMLCLMHSASQRGVLMANDVILDAKGLGKLVGESEENVKTLLNELESHSVFSRLENKAIICRRMYRQWQISTQRVRAGRRGANGKWMAKGMAKHRASSPTPSSTSIIEDTKGIYPYLKHENFVEAFKDYLLMRKSIRRPATPRAQELALMQLHRKPLNVAIAMLEQSILNSWQGIFDLKHPIPKDKPDQFKRKNGDAQYQKIKDSVDRTKPQVAKKINKLTEGIGKEVT